MSDVSIKTVHSRHRGVAEMICGAIRARFEKVMSMQQQTAQVPILEEESEAVRLDRLVSEITVDAQDLAQTYGEDAKVPGGGE